MTGERVEEAIAEIRLLGRKVYGDVDVEDSGGILISL